MEKFGIFELLDTLSALTAEPAPPEEAARTESGSAKDGTSQPDRGTPQPAAGRAGADALQGFLARHDEVARRADKKS